MLNKPITQRLTDTTPFVPAGFRPQTKRCPECKKRFELLSAAWVYKTKSNGKTHYQCSYTCWRGATKKQNPTPVLRGEKTAQKRIESGKETK